MLGRLMMFLMGITGPSAEAEEDYAANAAAAAKTKNDDEHANSLGNIFWIKKFQLGVLAIYKWMRHAFFVLNL